jgi:hypothetical protein
MALRQKFDLRKGRQMFDEKSIAPGLAELGYLRLKKRTFKASWSSADVEHFLFLSLHSGGHYFTCDFGIRNPPAERFALECLKLYGGPFFQTARFEPPRYRCSMRFSLGRLAGWGFRSSLTISDMSEVALADKVKSDVRDHLLPAVRSILAPADLFSLLIKDVEPCRWLGVSGALRSAIIVYLGRRMGIETRELESTLQPHLRDIIGGVQRGVAPSFFLSEVLREAN